MGIWECNLSRRQSPRSNLYRSSALEVKYCPILQAREGWVRRRGESHPPIQMRGNQKAGSLHYFRGPTLFVQDVGTKRNSEPHPYGSAPSSFGVSVRLSAPRIMAEVCCTIPRLAVSN